MNEFITIFSSTNTLKNIKLVNSVGNLNKTSLRFQVDKDQKKDMKTTVEIVAI